MVTYSRSHMRLQLFVAALLFLDGIGSDLSPSTPLPPPDSNYRALLGHIPSLAALADTPLARLEAVMGSAKNARALREFLDAPCPRL